MSKHCLTGTDDLRKNQLNFTCDKKKHSDKIDMSNLLSGLLSVIEMEISSSCIKMEERKHGKAIEIQSH